MHPKCIEGWVFTVYYTESSFASCTVIARTAKEAMEIAEIVHPSASINSIFQEDRPFMHEKPTPRQIFFQDESVKRNAK